MSTVYSGNKMSQYDSDEVIKDVHDSYGQALRTLDSRSVVSSYYSHFRAIYNVLNSPTEVTYYHGTKAHVTKFESIPSSFLDGRYITLNSAPDNGKYAIWFNLNGASTAPSLADTTLIEVPVQTGDSDLIVAVAIRVTVNGQYLDKFIVTQNDIDIEIKTSGLGIVDNSTDGNSAFIVTNVAGEQTEVQKITILYDGANPTYLGQVLRGYNYDIYSSKFVKNPEISVAVNDVTIADEDGDKLGINPDGSLNVNVVSTGQQLYSIFTEVDNVATGITVELVSYTAGSDVYLQKIELTGTNIAEFELVIDGVTQDKKRTFFNGNLENVFNFNAGLNILPGSIIQVFVVHNRPELGQFSARTQILQG